ncbi:hypothetical protein ACGRHY_29330 [Streptomyces sp. HK10]|uniref:hypothetical protein n=1 Tax=Streptomyces sp. HK10 TaxID=3373255 RepID=UPI003749658C
MRTTTETPHPAPRLTPEQVTADRLAVIARAVAHLDSTDHPTLLADLLRSIDADSPTGLRYSAFAGALSLLSAAGRAPR